MKSGVGDRPAVQLERVRFRHPGGEFELAIDALAIAPGERVAIVGPSGSGKSTLLHLAAGILHAGRGAVRFEGVDWARLSDAERRRRRIARIGLVFQELELLDHLTVRENVCLPYFVHPALRRTAEVDAYALELARSTGIEALLARRPRALSQGERQRVAICRALVTRPALVLADEPTGNLDAQTARRALDLLVAQASSRGATLVMVTHDAALLGAFERVIDLAELAGAGGALGVPKGRAR